jgi:hypothetical protein
MHIFIQQYIFQDIDLLFINGVKYFIDATHYLSLLYSISGKFRGST